MEGATIHWFNLLLETKDDLSWVKLKKALIARYGGRRLENPFEELSTLKQTGSVEEFVEAFELLSSQVGRLPEEQYLGYFMGGLKDPIRRRVRTFNPNTRMAVMRIAKDVESELKEGGDDDDRRYKRVMEIVWAAMTGMGPDLVMGLTQPKLDLNLIPQRVGATRHRKRVLLPLTRTLLIPQIL
jgi:hypothetical protein